MPHAPLRIKPHLAYEELTNCYRFCKNPIEKTRWQLIWLMANPVEPKLVTEAAKTIGFSERWARILVKRYNNNGPNGLMDQRRNNEGQKPALNEKQKVKLKNILLNEKPPDKGLWTSVKVADWIEQTTGYRPSAVTGWNYLRTLGFTLQQPRPRHSQAASPAEIRAFKKNFY